MIAATLNTFQQSSYGTFTTIPKGSQISSLQSYGFQVSACWIHPKPWHKTGTRNQVSPTTWTHNFISTMKSFSFGITLGKTSCPCSDITPIFSLAILLCSSSCPTEPQTKSLPINLWVPRTTTIVLEATVLVSAIPCNLLKIYGVRTCFYVEFLKIPIRGILLHPCTILILECLLRLMALAHYAGLQMTFVLPAERCQIPLWSEI